jgi:hypothetical protein
MPKGSQAFFVKCWIGRTRVSEVPGDLILRKLLGAGTPAVEGPLRPACFDRLFTLHVSDKSEAALQKPNLRVRCQLLRAIAYPAKSPALQEIHRMHHGLLNIRRLSTNGVVTDQVTDVRKRFMASRLLRCRLVGR